MCERAAIDARQFSFTYPAGEDAAAPRSSIGALDWHVPEGAFSLLVGATGSGKTTLLRCLKAPIAPHGEREGELLVFGQDAMSLSSARDAGIVGYVAQDPESQIVCDTVWHELAFGLENLGTPREQMRRRVAEIAHFFGIEPWFSQRTDELSGGQMQIVTLAGVLAMQPRLLVLDEPTAQLDAVAEKNFLHALFRVNRELGITVVVATHAPESCASYATECWELADGLMKRVPCERFEPQVLDTAPTGTADARCDGAHAASPAIDMHDAYVRYGRDGTWVLAGADLAVECGSVHALVGGNGCGKSTVLKTVAGILEPTRGHVHNTLASRQALLPQDPKALFVCDTAEEELREWQRACGYDDEDVCRTVELLGLAGSMHQHPYDLSGGQQQLLAFAKLALCDPDLLMLDEPTKGLDAHAKLVLGHALRDMAAGGTTVLMATHDLAFAALVADTVTMLFDGQATCTEPAREFFANNLFYRPMHDAFTRMWNAGGGDGAHDADGTGRTPGAVTDAGAGTAAVGDASNGTGRA